jgi:hypothetical protein
MRPEQVKAAVALRQVEAMGTTTDVGQLIALGSALGGLGRRLPAEQAKAVALRLVEAMGVTTDSGVFVALAEQLGALLLPEDPVTMDSAADLLQAPMAYGEARTHLLRYYSRLAGVFGTAYASESTDDLVAWVREHRSNLDLTRPPRNPFGSRLRSGSFE